MREQVMLRYKHIYFIVFIILTIVVPAHSNAADTCHRGNPTLLSSKRYVFGIKELPNQGQLPVANVHRILQDSEGYMWYATEGGGLCRDDGYSVEVFRSDRNTPSLLASNDITCMTEDGHGRIWFGTKAGAYILDKKNYTICRIEDNELRDAWTGCMFTASDSAVWIGTGANIYRYDSDGKTFGVFKSEWEGKAVNVTNFAETASTGVIAIQSQGGLMRFDAASQSFIAMKWDRTLRPNFIIPDLRHGGLWVATWGQGIVKYNFDKQNDGINILRQACTVGSDGEGSFRSQVFNMVYDKPRNILWAAAMDNLYAYEVRGDSLVAIDTRTFLPEGKKILDNIIADNAGNIWVPGYSPHTFIVYQKDNRMRRDEVKAMSDSVGYRVMVDMIAREDSRFFWIWQGRTQLSLYDSYTGRMVFANRNASPFPLSIGKCITKRNSDKGIWACNGRHIFRVWNEGGHILWKEEERASTAHRINTLYDRGEQLLYIGTDNSLCCYNEADGRLTTMAYNTGCVKEIACDKEGTVYFIADNMGLCRMERSRKVPQRIDIGKPSNDATFTSLTITPDGCVWAATSEGNVFCLPKGGKHPVDDEKAGNSNGDGIKKIVADKYGNLWILSDKYLREYSPETGTVHILYSSDADINMDYFHTICLEEDSICLGGLGAFCMIASMEQTESQFCSPRIAVTGIKVNGKVQMIGTGETRIEFSADDNEAELFVSAFEYLHADSLRFAYRMETDEEWTVLPEGVNSIVLHNLPYGENRMEVSVTGGNRYRTTTTEWFTVYRKSPWYATWQAYVVYAVALILILTALRLHRRKKEETETQEGTLLTIQPEAEKEEHHRTKKNDEEKDTPHISRQDEEFIRRATAVVEQNLDNAEYSVEQFSSDLCMSRMNLYRKLQNLTGQKPSEFIRSIRLKKAADILQSEDCSVAELVDRIGFGTPRYFSKCFKEMYGVSPSQYRQENERNPKVPDDISDSPHTN